MGEEFLTEGSEGGSYFGEGLENGEGGGRVGGLCACFILIVSRGSAGI